MEIDIDAYLKGWKNPYKRKRPGAQGEKCHRAVLTEQDVIEIKSSTEKTSVLSERYRVTPTTIQRVRSGKSWTHI